MDHEYQCGSLLGVVYWTLAHNVLRIDYNGISAGAELISQNHPTAEDPEFLANAAYTYAIGGLSGSAGIDSFFRRVSEFYWIVEQSGRLVGGDRHRVNQVLAVHCVGWSGWTCEDWHRTAEQDRPAKWTRKASFQRGDDQHFLRAEGMFRYGTPSGMSHGKADGLGFIRLDSVDDMVCAWLDFPTSGRYRLDVASKTSGSSEVWFYLGHGWEPMVVFADGRWTWTRRGSLRNVDAGSRPVCLLYKSGAINLDAVLVTRQ